MNRRVLPFRHGVAVQINAVLRGLALLSLLAVFGSASPVQSDDWMYRRSYFSHALPENLPPNYPLPVSRSGYRVAHYREGFGVSTGYRWNNYAIQNGARVDRTLYLEGWVEMLPQNR
jgi:hypothetical protein